MKYDYEFYKYSRLVVDILIHPNGLEISNGLEIPYDLEYDIVVASYERYMAAEVEGVVDPYNHMTKWIQADKELYDQLVACSE